MVEIIENGQANMVIGSRFIEDTGYKQTFARMLGIRINSGIIKLLTKKKIYDFTNSKYNNIYNQRNLLHTTNYIAYIISTTRQNSSDIYQYENLNKIRILHAELSE